MQSQGKNNVCLFSSLKTQSCIRRPFVVFVYLKFIIIFFDFFSILFNFILCNFLVWTLQYFLKILTLFCPRKHEKNALIISQDFFFSVPAWLPKRPKKQKSHTTKSPLMQDWVFRLGSILRLLRYGIFHGWTKRHKSHVFYCLV